MRTWWVRGTTLALLLLPICASAEGRPFDKPLLTDPAYTAVRTLERAGYFTGFPGNTFAVPRTRYEFAVAVERLYRSIQPRVLSAVVAGTLPQDLETLRALLDAFGDDVADLGHDAQEMGRQVDAMRERVERLPKDPEEVQDALPSRSPAPVTAAPESRLRFGLRPSMRASLRESVLAPAGPAFSRPLTQFSVKPGLAANLGPALFGLEVQPPDRLSFDESLPLTDPDAGRSYRAQLSLPVGGYLLSAFYRREGALWDRFNLSGLGAAGLGRSELIGAEVTGTLFSPRLGFALQGGTVRSLEDDQSRALSFGGAFRYDLGNGFNVDLGYSLSRQLGLGMDYSNSGLMMGLGRSLGRNTRLDAIYRGGDNSSTIGQITVKF